MVTSKGRHRAARVSAGVEGNARLTSFMAALLLIGLFVEGLTILRIGNLFVEHVFIGTLLIQPIALKIMSTSWRFFKYYSGDREYRRKGPPFLILRLLGPVVVVLTVILFASGVALIVVPHTAHGTLFFVHRASFVLWFLAMTVHVLGHLGETVRLAPRDWMKRTRRQVVYSSRRQWAEAASLVLGLLFALALTPSAYGWLTQG
jgi:hypothetical protein